MAASGWVAGDDCEGCGGGCGVSGLSGFAVGLRNVDCSGQYVGWRC